MDRQTDGRTESLYQYRASHTGVLECERVLKSGTGTGDTTVGCAARLCYTAAVDNTGQQQCRQCLSRHLLGEFPSPKSRKSHQKILFRPASYAK